MNIAHIDHLTINLYQPGALLSTLESLSDPTAPAFTQAPIAGLHPPAAGEIWPGQGGHFICYLPAAFGLPARHLVLATAEQDELAWGGYDSDCEGAQSQTDGWTNTRSLLNDSTPHPAAQWAAEWTADGHKDFHLPSRHDLYMCYLHAPHLFKASGWYWSSSQSSRSNAWCQAFEYGYSSAHNKDYEFRARPVRWIHL